jgi:hypothetical protein
MIYLHLVEVTPELEDRFWRIVEKDYCDYYFFIYDWLLQRSKTKIFLALEGDAVSGLMVVFDGHIVQMRGEAEAIKFMLKDLQLMPADVQVPSKFENLLTAKYPTAKLKAHITIMRLKRGQQNLSITVEPEKLIPEDASEIAELMHEANPSLWGGITAKGVAALFSAKEALWLGIKLGGKLASFGYAMLTPKMCHISWIATQSSNEGKGYATSIVSGLVRSCLDVADGAVIYVKDDNAVAKAIYSKVGFRSYKSYVFVRT